MNKERITTIDMRTRHLLDLFTREELRNFAKELGLSRGRNKRDTTIKIASSGQAQFAIQLRRKP